jgi:predicted Fe-Mo cluster-binding NifX family protein
MICCHWVADRGISAMKVALTVWENRISPVFDSTRTLLVADIGNHRVIDQHFEPFDCETPFARAAKLYDLGVRVLICGAVSNLFANPIEAYGIRIIPFVAGAVNEVLDAYLSDTICTTRFRMPGC